MEYHHQSFDITIIITKQTRLQNAHAVILLLLQSARKGPSHYEKGKAIFHHLEKLYSPWNLATNESQSHLRCTNIRKETKHFT